MYIGEHATQLPRMQSCSSTLRQEENSWNMEAIHQEWQKGVMELFLKVMEKEAITEDEQPAVVYCHLKPGGDTKCTIQMTAIRVERMWQ
ncbi:unnamed protein product [Sphagnum jensenii]|uniref:Uncharacterized protein n=1 Tax=Sphagnum jensenii TaxID=128206 RepID=A0ABP1B0D7_9BRYO